MDGNATTRPQGGNCDERILQEKVIEKMEKTKKSISTNDWVEKYQDEFIQYIEENEVVLDLFHFTLDKLAIFRTRVLYNSGLSSYNKSHKKIIDAIDKELDDYVNERLCGLLNIKKSKDD